eukprot:NODE_7267_length_794_cov_108.320417_g6658_i0.p1 GENE.NODE_7267_length_794_cov_108.320417_g6658_i0~~NODE_7267_length_794_cov_108.320417_g6658_i0.p1  ORF type:complete len:204 (-),score=36.27 NODE_7267_length_794_cov_108.320417_g6658_i0:182-739(-)
MKLAIVLSLIAYALCGCPSPPTVDTVDLTRYVGRWYQIAVSKTFEETIESKSKACTTAFYTLQSDGSVQVNNSGRATPDAATETAIGKALQVSGGKLKVSFFGPFFAPYWIVELFGEANFGYSVALIYSCTNELIFTAESMWLLSRTPQLPQNVTQQQVYDRAQTLGIDVAGLGMRNTVQEGCGW